jgi:hypothetical protein
MPTASTLLLESALALSVFFLVLKTRSLTYLHLTEAMFFINRVATFQNIARISKRISDNQFSPIEYAKLSALYLILLRLHSDVVYSDSVDWSKLAAKSQNLIVPFLVAPWLTLNPRALRLLRYISTSVTALYHHGHMKKYHMVELTLENVWLCYGFNFFSGSSH